MLIHYMMVSREKTRFEAVLDVYKLRGFSWSTKYFILSIASLLVSPLWYFVYRIQYDTDSLSQKEFIFKSFKNKKFSYFHHKYNSTWANERRIEIPLIKYYVTGSNPGKILELGNVMSHYIKAKHDIVDEYEYDPGIINVDILNYKTKKKYDLIFSISTLEHIGIDGEKDPSKALKTLKHLTTLLSQKGRIVFTIPVGYNKLLDHAISKDSSLFSELYYFKRVTGNNKWVEIDSKAAGKVSYGFPYRWGNAIVLGFIQHKPHSHK